MAVMGKGFSLVELVVAIAIMGVLMALGLPALTTYTRNVKLRAGAESFLAGLQMARGEAVRLNTPVELILTNSPPVTDDGTDGNFPVLAEVVVDNLGNLVATGKVGGQFSRRPRPVPQLTRVLTGWCEHCPRRGAPVRPMARHNRPRPAGLLQESGALKAVERMWTRHRRF
ncbi:MAG: GspH/FimT family pseudopilin [Propionivibrio sp.]|uniref:Type II secretion system protein H n=1 Tax=Candidatus Propionivibrio dominans TaxID=2954373 RepID=A0A9D7FE85_9RHOO|nr:GspH/FimT family pseudopilin [Candidatus Propionivibrio dominans]